MTVPVRRVEFYDAGALDLPDHPLHQSAAATIGEFCFLSGIQATTNRGTLVPEALPNPGLPFHESGTALQARVVLDRIARAMRHLGGSIEDGVYIQQFFTGKQHFEPYRSIGRDFLPGDRPPSTALPCNALTATEAVLEVDLTAMLPTGGTTRQRISTDTSPKVLGSYAQGVRVGDWIHLAGATPADHTRTAGPFPGGRGTAVAPEARVDANMWYGSPIEKQVEYIMTKKQLAVLEAAGSSLERIVKADVYLAHPAEDLRGFHRVWRELFGDQAPATTVVPIDGFGSADSRIEIGIVALSSNSPIEIERLNVASLPPAAGPYPHGVKAGPLVFLSTVIAADEDGLVSSALPTSASRNTRPQVIDEFEYCAHVIEEICAAAGTQLRNVVRRRNHYTHISDVFAADQVVKSVWPSNPPTSTNVGISGPHIVPNARLAMDVIAAVA